MKSSRLRSQTVGVAFAAAASACSAQRPQSAPVEQLDPYRESLVRAVPLDSLAKLYRAMLVAPDPKPIARETVCEGVRLSYTHGGFIVDVADRRLRDSLYGHADRAAYERMDQRLAGGSLPLRYYDCHVPAWLPKAPDSLDFAPLPPPLPRRP